MLASGDEIVSLPAEVSERRATPPPAVASASGPLEGVQAAAILPLDHPVLAAFQGSGRLTIGWGAATLRLDAGLEDRHALAALWRSCD